MAKYILSRILQSLPVLFVSSVLIFGIVQLLPGDPAIVLVGADASEGAIEAARRDLGLDQPLPVQYMTWLSGVLRGDLGVSYIYSTPVADLVLSRIPVSLLLAVTSITIATVIAIPLGVAAALREGSVADWMVSAATGVMIATPNFWFGILVILLFAVHLGWLPPGGYVPFEHGLGTGLSHLLLPALTLAVNEIAILARFTRGCLLDTIGQDFIRTARAKGAGTLRVFVKHALRNAMLPILTMIGILFGTAAGGVIVIESVFAWPGLGRLLVDAIGGRDYAVIQGALLVLVLLFLIVNFIVDLLYGVLDPRVRLSGRETS